VRNVGGGRPGEVDRATHGSPGKIGFCFAENDAESPYGTIAIEHGIAPGTAWADVPMNWTCPECGARKEDFEMVQI